MDKNFDLELKARILLDFLSEVSVERKPNFLRIHELFVRLYDIPVTEEQFLEIILRIYHGNDEGNLSH